MEPVPESKDVIESLSEAGGVDLEVELRRTARQVRDIAPACVGLSLTVRTEDSLTLTLVATPEDLAELDALQYLDGGPCVAALEEDQVVHLRHIDSSVEDHWQLYRNGTAAKGIHASLSMPLREDHRVLGSVNLYGARSDAFSGHEEQLAALFGARGPELVRDADLDFASRRAAAVAPDLLAARSAIDQAAGVLVASQGIDIGTARKNLRMAAEVAGINEVQLAELILGDTTA